MTGQPIAAGKNNSLSESASALKAIAEYRVDESGSS